MHKEIVSPHEVRIVLKFPCVTLMGEVLLKEIVIFSSKVNQPILCYGRLMGHDWGINSRGQMLENGDLKVPLNLQNRY